MPILAAVLLAATAFAADKPRPHCREGSLPQFTGHPFIPWRCPEDIRAPQNLPLQPRFELPLRKDKATTKLAPFAGRWGGIVYYGGHQYEVHARVRPSWRGAVVEWSSMDYFVHDRRDYAAKLSLKWFEGAGHYAGTVSLAPFSPLPFDAWLGAPSTTTAAGLDRELVLQYQSRPDGHVLFLGRDGADALRFEYYYDEPGQPRRRAAGELTRQKQP
jgi:hypothetical protein